MYVLSLAGYRATLEQSRELIHPRNLPSYAIQPLRVGLEQPLAVRICEARV